MVTEIVEKIALIILFSLFPVEYAAMNNCFIKNDILLYENFCQNEIIFPEEYLLSKEDVCCTDSILVNEECLSQMGSNKITGDMFDILCSFDLINRWSFFKQSELNPYSYNYIKFLENIKREMDIFYLGKLKLSDSFNSYLILILEGEQDDYQIIKSVYLINTADRKATSITRISSYTCFDGDCHHIYTEVYEKGVFIQIDKEVSSGVILPEEMQTENEMTSIKFTYDGKGYLKIL